MSPEDPKQRSMDSQRAAATAEGAPDKRLPACAARLPGLRTRPLIKSEPVPVQRRWPASRLPTRAVSENCLADWTNAVFRPDLYTPPVQRKTPGGASTQAEPAIAGPLQPGETRASGAVIVEQVSAHSTAIMLGESRITIDGTGTKGSACSYHVDAGRGTGQRVVRIFATADIAIGEQHDPHAREQLICHCWRVPAPALAQARPHALTGAQAPDSESDILTQVRSEGKRLVAVNLSLDGAGLDIRASEPGAAFTYDIDERWSGTSGLERVVTVIATPGVAIEERPALMAALPIDTPGRRLVPRILRVNTASEVPSHDGTGRSSKRIRAGEHVRSERHPGTNPQDSKSALLATRGGQGVTVRESKTGAWMEIRPKDARIGGAYAYEIVPAAEGGATEIRALVGPGMIVEVLEPGPDRSRLGGVPDPGLAEMNVRLLLYRTDDAAAVPAQGTRLTEQLLQDRGKLSEPDTVTRRALTPAETAALAVTDTMMSAVPGAGDVMDLVELGYAAMAGQDRYGRKVSSLELAIMGVAVLIPFVGGGALRGALRAGKGAKGAHALSDVAAHFGRTEAELEALLVQVSELTPQDYRAVQRIEAAFKEGKAPDAEDVKHMRESLGHLGFAMDAPTREVDILPNAMPSQYEHMMWGKPRAEEDVGSTVEVGSVRAGVSRPPRHHVLPQEHRAWFEERGFTGDNSIDKYCVELDSSTHQAIHGGGDMRRGRQWPGEWNRMIMDRLLKREKRIRRKLRPDEILTLVRQAMKEYEINQSFVHYRSQQP